MCFAFWMALSTYVYMHNRPSPVSIFLLFLWTWDGYPVPAFLFGLLALCLHQASYITGWISTVLRLIHHLQHVLERGKPHERSQIISKLTGKIVPMSQHKYASNVVEKCLEHGDAAEREFLIDEILVQSEDNDNLLVSYLERFYTICAADYLWGYQG